MPEQVVLTLHLTSEQIERIAARADERGYGTVEEYMLNLVEDDVSETKAELLAGLRESLHQAMTGHAIPWEQAFAELEAEADDDDR